MARKDDNRRSAFDQFLSALQSVEQRINEEIETSSKRTGGRKSQPQTTFEQRQALRNRKAQSQGRREAKKQAPSWRDQAPTGPPVDGRQTRGRQEYPPQHDPREGRGERGLRDKRQQFWQGSMNNPQPSQEDWRKAQEQEAREKKRKTRVGDYSNDSLDEERNTYGLSPREYESMKRRAEANGRSLTAQLSREEQARDDQVYYDAIFGAESGKNLQITNLETEMDGNKSQQEKENRDLIKEIRYEATGPNRRRHIAKAIVWSEILNKPKSRR